MEKIEQCLCHPFYEDVPFTR